MKPITPAMRQVLFLDDGHGRLEVSPRMGRALVARGLVDSYHRITDRGRRIRALVATELAAEGVVAPLLRRYLTATDSALGHIAAGLPVPDHARLDEALGLLDYEATGSGPALHWARLAVVLPWPHGEVAHRWRAYTFENPLQVTPLLRRLVDDTERGMLTVNGMRRAQTMFMERLRAAEARDLEPDAWVEAISLAASCSLGLPGDPGGAWSSPLAGSVAWWSGRRGLSRLVPLANAIDEYRFAEALDLLDGVERLREAPADLLRAVRQWAFDARAAGGGPMPVSLLGGALIGMPVDGKQSNDPPAGTREEMDRLAALEWSGEPRVGDALHWFDGQFIRAVPWRAVTPRNGINRVLDFGDFGDPPAEVEDLPTFRGLGQAVQMLEAAGRVSARLGLAPSTPQIERDGAIWWFRDGELLHAPLGREGDADFDNASEVDDADIIAQCRTAIEAAQLPADWWLTELP